MVQQTSLLQPLVCIYTAACEKYTNIFINHGFLISLSLLQIYACKNMVGIFQQKVHR